MRDEITANYETLDGVVQSLGTNCDSLQAVHKNLTQQVDTLRSNGWSGRGSDAFYNEMTNDVLPRLQRIVRAFDEACTCVNQMSTILQDAEDEASSAFRI